MTRKKTLKYYSGFCAFYDCTETYTHKIVLDDGCILRADPEDNFYGIFSDNGETSWFGTPPKGWDDSIAVEEEYVRGPFEMEIDVS